MRKTKFNPGADMTPNEKGRAGEKSGAATNSTDPQISGDISVFRRIILDRRISHGSFRLWHYLHDRKNRNGQTWPQQRQIAADIGCKTHSLLGWIKELVAAGYLHVEKVGQKHFCRYTVLPGNDLPFVLPKWTTRKVSGVAQSGNAKNEPCCPKGSIVLPKAATPRVAQKGNVSKYQGVSSMSKGDNPLEKLQGWQLRKDLRETTDPAESAAIKAEMRRRKSKSVRPAIPATPPQAKPDSKPFTPSAELAAKFREQVEAAIRR